MKKMYRNMMLFTATVIFLAVAPLVVLYAMGYRMGSTTVDPLPVGVLSVETVPRRSQMVVNGVNHGDTPRTISGLTPGDIPVSVSREGYQPWNKTIRIEPGLVSEFRDIRLFPTELTKTKLADNITSFSLSPNRALLATVTTDRILNIMDEEGTVISTPIQLIAQPSQLLWSPDSASILLLYARASGQVITVG